ncbi:MAG: methyltransferase domain-containing protein [Spirochaetota bacterium]
MRIGTSSPIKVNIASGLKVLPGYINYDNSIWLLMVPFRRLLRPVFPRWSWIERSERFYEAKKRAPLFYHDCTKSLPFPDISVDEINCTHFLEHVYRSEAVAIVKDYHRVLKEGGKLLIEVPDLEKYIHQYLEADLKNKRADQFIEKTLLTLRERPGLFMKALQFFGFFSRHRWLYDEDSLTALVKECGFVDVTSEKVGGESIMITATKRARGLMEEPTCSITDKARLIPASLRKQRSASVERQRE